MHKVKCLSLFLNLSFLLLISCLAVDQLYSSSSNVKFLNKFRWSLHKHLISDDGNGCKGLQESNQDKQAKCSYVKSQKGCQPRGYISYLQLFYCNFTPVLGYILLVLWLVLLFYLLGDTASKYFCSSLEGLARSLRLSPTIAGVTLLSLGNGAPDIFASMISFLGDGTKEIGLNSILGGAFFVSSMVVGIVSISVSHQNRRISKSGFIGNVLFLFTCLSCLLVILIIGKINLWGALSFLSLYLVYVCFIIISEVCAKEEKLAQMTADRSILPLDRCKSSLKQNTEGFAELGAPLLAAIVEDGSKFSQPETTDEQRKGSRSTKCKALLNVLELPLYLPRRLTIPIISEESWSKPYTVTSVTLAPILLAAIKNFQSSETSNLVYAIGVIIGIGSGAAVFFTTSSHNPPRKYIFPLLGAGFFMSIIWTYILAQELISLLVSLGLMLGINNSILGLTVLAWGNSLGDLVANVTMAKKGGPVGAQIALSGCYAGPMFNTVVGLGLSFTVSAWVKYPSPYDITKDPSDYETIGFLMVGLLWALVILTQRKMRLNRFLGGGLLAIYTCFLLFKLAKTIGLAELGLSTT